MAAAQDRDRGRGSPEITADDLTGVTEDRWQAVELHRALRVLAASEAADPALRQLAQDVLGGLIGVPDVAGAARYLMELGHRLERQPAVVESGAADAAEQSAEW
ncbi:hypothetical protein [Streptomyces sp. TLI_171]|uniref:hypothetical protein n=1 Tax=Streptomyces sp. TLI_171 TaxID=1938859 RepID=UPI000C1A7E93|nr:hypothetical protein [Streptomyces sp. TLI_171]RKE23317.1 hypothetical protein BX266_6781 [Streptomyces sp. TLI_171]